jgi:pyruvate formate lyase activating enzyme
VSFAATIPSDSPTGLIFNLMRFALHDGPGIRTTVFLKGCPLSCWWCHNPESQSFLPEMMFSAGRCVGCAECCDRCRHGALRWDSEPLRDPSLCILCGDCVEACPAEARQLMGKRISVADLLKTLRRDSVFFDESGGGVTFSGGEPLAQPEFLEAALAACKDAGIRTVVDTCGYAAASVVRRISKLTDLFLYDLKLMDDTLHRSYVGVSNEPILENLGILAREHGRVNVRIPIIPAVNDDEQNLDASISFLEKVGLRRVNLLPYHQIGLEKYARLQAPYRLEQVAPPTPDRMQQVAAKFASKGFEVRIGG